MKCLMPAVYSSKWDKLDLLTKHRKSNQRYDIRKKFLKWWDADSMHMVTMRNQCLSSTFCGSWRQRWTCLSCTRKRRSFTDVIYSHKCYPCSDRHGRRCLRFSTGAQGGAVTWGSTSLYDRRKPLCRQTYSLRWMNRFPKIFCWAANYRSHDRRGIG